MYVFFFSFLGLCSIEIMDIPLYTLGFIFFLLNFLLFHLWTREMRGWRDGLAFVALAEDAVSVLSIHMVAYNHP